MQRVLAFLKRFWKFAVAALVFVVALIFILNRNAAPDWVAGTVERGTVSNIISVTGTLDSENTAELSFPLGGILESVSVKEGDSVPKDSALAALEHDDLNAEYQNAYAALLIAQADRAELLRGLRPEERDISRTELQIAEENLARIKKENEDRVQNAFRTLLSEDLAARPKNKNSEDAPPAVTGTYTCEKEGVYVLDTYPSGADSGYSYRLSGLGSGTFTAFTQSPSPLGSCGLFIQFAENATYGNSTWTISVPNKEGNSYVTNLNAYELAQTEHDNAIAEAEQNVTLARQNAALDIADPRTESRTREEAKVLQAEAQLAKVNAQIRDHILRAPFNGVVSSIDLVPGEIVGTGPVITIVSNDAFTITALVPEIDITKLSINQKAHIRFDAQENETLPATILFVSPLAREIDGVSYFEVILALDNPPDWIRSGLNADIDIVIETRENVLRIPRRFLVEENGSHTVLVPHGDAETRSVPISVEFEGNDGYVQVSGLNEGDTVVAP
jgi:RND family efflux transporter MFP subunit